MKIIKTSEALPKSGRYVLAWLEGAKIPMRAMWAAQHTLPLGDDADPEWGEYSEEKDEYFCPAGWYEMNQFEEQHWSVDGNVVAWCALPRLDHQCLAQIEEPALPVAEICSASHDDAQFGERAIKPLCDISGFEYGTPLYAGAAPAAVAPQGMYPPLPEPVADWVQRGSVSTGGGSLGHEIGREGVFTAAQMRAYFDLGRQAAPALEAPAHQCCNSWFLSLPEGRQAVLRENQWMLADAAYQAGRESSRALEAPAAQDLPADDFRGDTPSLVRNIIALLELDAEGALVPHGVGGHARGLLSAAAARLAAAPQAPAAPSEIDAREQVTRALGFEGNGLIPFAWSYLIGQIEQLVECEAELCALKAAPAAPAVDASFEDLISDWAHGDALDAEHYRTLSQAARDVLAERRRQVNAEGFSPERDDQYVGGQLAGAATSYLILAAGGREDEARAFWPWRQEWLKPGSQRRYLEKACALGLAEMERQDRAAAAKEGGA